MNAVNKRVHHYQPRVAIQFPIVTHVPSIDAHRMSGRDAATKPCYHVPVPRFPTPPKKELTGTPRHRFGRVPSSHSQLRRSATTQLSQSSLNVSSYKVTTRSKTYCMRKKKKIYRQQNMTVTSMRYYTDVLKMCVFNTPWSILHHEVVKKRAFRCCPAFVEAEICIFTNVRKHLPLDAPSGHS